MTTPGGLILPADTEPVRAGAGRMRYLATQLDQSPIERVAFRDSAMNVAHETWVRMTGWAGSNYAQGTNAEMQVSPTGVLIRRTGRYFIEAEWEHPNANANGHVAVGVDLATADRPELITDYARMLGAQGWQQTVKCRGSRTLTAGQTYTIFCFQSSGGTVAANRFRLGIRSLMPGQLHP